LSKAWTRAFARRFERGIEVLKKLGCELVEIRMPIQIMRLRRITLLRLQKRVRIWRGTMACVWMRANNDSLISMYRKRVELDLAAEVNDDCSRKYVLSADITMRIT